jgi:two-component system nitrogen regulation response regulator NtrX
MDDWKRWKGLGAGECPEVIILPATAPLKPRYARLSSGLRFLRSRSSRKTLILIKHAVEAKKLRQENRDLKKQLAQKTVIVGDSIPAKALRQQIQLMAPTNGRVLVFGESEPARNRWREPFTPKARARDEMFVELTAQPYLKI